MGNKGKAGVKGDKVKSCDFLSIYAISYFYYQSGLLTKLLPNAFFYLRAPLVKQVLKESKDLGYLFKRILCFCISHKQNESINHSINNII